MQINALQNYVGQENLFVNFSELEQFDIFHRFLEINCNSPQMSSPTCIYHDDKLISSNIFLHHFPYNVTKIFVSKQKFLNFYELNSSVSSRDEQNWTSQICVGGSWGEGRICGCSCTITER